MKFRVHLIRTWLIAFIYFFLFSCESQEPVVQEHIVQESEVQEPKVKTSQNTNARIGILERITINTTDVTTTVATALAGRSYKNISQIFASNQAMQNGTRSATTKLVSLDKFKFNTNEQKDTRRPQGTANYGDYIINSWYFTGESAWEGNCKFTITKITGEKYFNVVPVQLHSTQAGKFKHIDSHASGLTVFGHYLYMTGSGGTSILVFDLDKIYTIQNKPDSNVAVGQDFIYEYTYMLPQVGTIIFATDSGAKASYLSRTTRDGIDYFVAGNFFSTADSDYSSGGKSMIWLLPATNTSYSFPTIQPNPSRIYTQIDPVFPSGDDKGTRLTRIQGAIIKDNVLILNRSYSTETYQLIVMRYADILVDPPVLTDFFSGTTSNKHGYNKENWLKGCEDMEFYNDRVYTITEFPEGILVGDRASYSATYSSIIGLMAPAN